jgi:hypothetical protein
MPCSKSCALIAGKRSLIRTLRKDVRGVARVNCVKVFVARNAAHAASGNTHMLLLQAMTRWQSRCLFAQHAVRNTSSIHVPFVIKSKRDDNSMPELCKDRSAPQFFDAKLASPATFVTNRKVMVAVSKRRHGTAGCADRVGCSAATYVEIRKGRHISHQTCWNMHNGTVENVCA